MRKKSLRTFARKSDSLHVIVATSAFGLGVNLQVHLRRRASLSQHQCVIHLYATCSVQAYDP